MEFCPNLDMIRDYFTKALHGYQFLRFPNIILGIHEYDISYHNASGRSFIEERNMKLDRDNE